MDQLVPAIAALLAGIGAYLAGKARNEAKAAGNILNGNAPIRAPSNPRIYDMIFDLGKKVETIGEEVSRLRANCPNCPEHPDNHAPPAA